MSRSNEGTIAVLGGPESGKSTWLGAVLDSLQRRASQALRFQSRGWPRDATMVDKLTAPLAAARYPVRTPRVEEGEIELGLRAEHEALGVREFQLVVSDYAGEQIDALFEHRTKGWTASWRARADAVGLLVFVRPPANLPLPRIVQVTEGSPWAQVLSDPPAAPTRKVLGPISPEELFPSIHDEVPSVPCPGPRDPVRVPSVLALVELLQFLRAERGYGLGYRPPRGAMRIAVVVSAWDAVASEWREKGPTRYLVEHMSLLEQFIWSNFKSDDIFYFGLSTTGGDLNEPEYHKKYEDEPNGWCEWLGLDGRIMHTSEISLPLLWTLFGDSALSLGDTDA